MGTVETYNSKGVLVDTRTVDTHEQDNAEALDARMNAALAALRTYVNNPTPTAAQTSASVKLLCRVAIALIRHRLSRFEDVD